MRNLGRGRLRSRSRSVLAEDRCSARAVLYTQCMILCVLACCAQLPWSAAGETAQEPFAKERGERVPADADLNKKLEMQLPAAKSDANKDEEQKTGQSLHTLEPTARHIYDEQGTESVHLTLAQHQKAVLVERQQEQQKTDKAELALTQDGKQALVTANGATAPEENMNTQQGAAAGKATESRLTAIHADTSATPTPLAQEHTTGRRGEGELVVGHQRQERFDEQEGNRLLYWLRAAFKSTFSAMVTATLVCLILYARHRRNEHKGKGERRKATNVLTEMAQVPHILVALLVSFLIALLGWMIYFGGGVAAVVVYPVVVGLLFLMATCGWWINQIRITPEGSKTTYQRV
eukprot:CAMPEP_0177665868 /NCGR_PEP_ID=MMETSP0447-20121125/21281_1 /TAXON_ID=0 /ORGANISM="Stygamoeba regulata, Strain BSH-02190019" /LENGTH=348 /DNA_ID=CAMNT_0019171985 /DNA_START=59 /DNA_END=1106 /DNA_ORIENTATION=-